MSYKKVNRPTALKKFIEGIQICVCPCKLRPEFGCIVDIYNDRSFVQCENEVNYYLCGTETGKRLSYYIIGI